MARKLTARKVEQARPNPRKRIEIPDGGKPGLYLVIQSSAKVLGGALPLPGAGTQAHARWLPLVGFGSQAGARGVGQGCRRI